MKSLYNSTVILFLILGLSVKGQIKIGNNPNSINSNSILELESTNKGLLFPRVSLTSLTSPSPLSSHVEGMFVYNTNTNSDVSPGYYYNDGTKWIKGGKNNWDLGGNTLTTSDFIGSLNEESFKIRINNIEKVRIEPSGTIALPNNRESVYIGTGAGALDQATPSFSSGSYLPNVFIGELSGTSNTSGHLNVAIGKNGLKLNTSGKWNVSMGGIGALDENTTGISNTAIGEISAGHSTTGSNNSGLGFRSLYSNTTGDYNCSIGVDALYSNKTGDNNTAVGSKAYKNGQYNGSTALGYATAITASNQVRIGNSTVTSIGGYQAWTNLSDGRFKKSIKEDVPGLDFILQLRPVTYNVDSKKLHNFLYNRDISKENLSEDQIAEGQENYTYSLDEYTLNAIERESQVIHTGFIAQEVEEIAKNLGFDFSGIDKPKNDEDHYGLRYAEFVVPLVKSVQEQQLLILEQQKQIDALKALVEQLTK